MWRRGPTGGSSLSLTDGSGKSVAQLNAPLVSDTYLTTMWQEGEIVRGEHDLQIPADLPPDTLPAEPDAAAGSADGSGKRVPWERCGSEGRVTTKSSKAHHAIAL